MKDINRRNFLKQCGLAGAVLAALPGMTLGQDTKDNSITLALVGPAHSHTGGIFNVLNKHKEVKIKHVWDHDVTRGKKWAEKLKTTFTPDVHAIWIDPEIQGAVIFAETSLHKELALAGTKAHKNLFIEKPLAITTHDACEMADAIEKAGILFSTGFAQRSDPMHIFIKSQIVSGNLGTISHIRASACHDGVLSDKFSFNSEFHWIVDPKLAGFGGFGDLGTHSLDLLMWLMGDVEEVTAEIRSVTKRFGNIDETGEALLRFKNGTTGCISAGWVDVANPASLLVSGTLGHAAILNNKLYFKSSKVPGADGTQPWTDLPAAMPSPLEAFVMAVGGSKDATLINPREAASRVSVMEAIYRSSNKRKWLSPQKV